MYSFHPTGVAHLYPLAPSPASRQLRLTPRHRSTENETNCYDTILSPQVRMHPLARGRPGVVWPHPLPSGVYIRPMLLPHRASPAHTLLLTGLVTRIASSDRVHPHNR